MLAVNPTKGSEITENLIFSFQLKLISFIICLVSLRSEDLQEYEKVAAEWKHNRKTHIHGDADAMNINKVKKREIINDRLGIKSNATTL